MQNLKTSTEVVLNGKAFQVGYPNVGQKMKIENLKVLLTNGQYGDFVRSGHKTGLELLDLVDSFANFGVLIQELNLGIDDFNNMSIETGNQFKKAYLGTFFPFLVEVEKQLEAVTNKSEDDTETPS